MWSYLASLGTRAGGQQPAGNGPMANVQAEEDDIALAIQLSLEEQQASDRESFPDEGLPLKNILEIGEQLGLSDEQLKEVEKSYGNFRQEVSSIYSILKDMDPTTFSNAFFSLSEFRQAALKEELQKNLQTDSHVNRINAFVNLFSFVKEEFERINQPASSALPFNKDESSLPTVEQEDDELALALQVSQQAFVEHKLTKKKSDSSGDAPAAAVPAQAPLTEAEQEALNKEEMKLTRLIRFDLNAQNVSAYKEALEQHTHWADQQTFQEKQTCLKQQVNLLEEYRISTKDYTVEDFNCFLLGYVAKETASPVLVVYPKNEEKPKHEKTHEREKQSRLAMKEEGKKKPRL